MLKKKYVTLVIILVSIVLLIKLVLLNVVGMLKIETHFLNVLVKLDIMIKKMLMGIMYMTAFYVLILQLNVYQK